MTVKVADLFCGERVDAARTHQLLAEIRAAGFKQVAVARMLGYNGRAPQMKGRSVTKANAERVERLHRRLVLGDATAGELPPPRRQREHGQSFTPEYRAWQTMRLRCLNPSNRAYPAYGGRGITVCDRWLDDFEAFLADVGAKPSARHELDRIDNNRGYEPSNCRWVTRSQNDRNRRSTLWVDYRGERRRLIDLCEQFGTWLDTVKFRLEHGWTMEAAVETPTRAQANGRGRFNPSEQVIPQRKAKRQEAVA